MTKEVPSARITRNHLLSLLPAEDLAALTPHLRPITMKAGVVLIAPDKPIKKVYFVLDGLVSLVQLMANGKYHETGIIGREGMVGALAALGASAFSHEAVVQIEGEALCLDADRLRIEVALSPAVRDLSLRYIQALFSQVARSVVCNGHHPVRQRLARWLLMASDCTESTDLALTHELLATMLGVRRVGVTQGIASLKEDRLISPRRGGVKIVDMNGLRATACECYGAVREDVRRLLGDSVFPARR